VNGFVRFFLNGFSNYIRFGVQTIVFILLTPIILQKAGVEEFGLWSLALSIVGMAGLLDFGFTTGTVKFVAECHGTENTHRRNSILSTILLFHIVVAGIALPILFLTENQLLTFLGVTENRADMAKTLIRLFLVRALLIQIPLGVFRTALFAEKKIVITNLIQATSFFLFGVFGWAFLHLGYGIVSLGWTTFVISIIEYIAYTFFAFRYLKKLRIGYSLAKMNLYRKTLSFSYTQWPSILRRLFSSAPIF
jgi:O-antigen/teichoic acid export membrane protein